VPFLLPLPFKHPLRPYFFSQTSHNLSNLPALETDNAYSRWNSIQYLLNAEIYPLRIRAVSSSLVMCFHFGKSNFVSELEKIDQHLK
jgi:hypothetical protein